jgi:hypothetical protein
MLTEAEITLNREIAILSLQVNIEGHKQVRSILTNMDDGYCAIGQIGEALHLSPKIENEITVYRGVAEKLGINEELVRRIYRWNDNGCSFKEIASRLSKMWNIGG